MPKLGRQTTVGYAVEGTRNTAETTASKFYSFNEFTMDVKNEYFEDESAFGRREAMLGKEIAQQSVEGNLSDYLDVDGFIGEALAHVFGQVVSAQDGVTGAYTHTFDQVLNNVEVPTFTLQYTKADIGNLRARGVGIKTLEIDITEKECNVKAELIGLAEESGDSQTVVLSKPSRPLLGKNVISKMASSVSELAAGTEFKIRKLNIKIDTGLDYDPAFGSINPYDTRGGSFKVETSFSGVIRNTDFYNLNLNNTKQAFEFDANATNLPVLGTSTLYPRLRVRIPPSTVEVTHSYDIDDLIMFDAKVNAEYSAVDNYMIECLLQNTTASYLS